MSLFSRTTGPPPTPGKDPLDGPAMRPPPGVKPVYTASPPDQPWFFAFATISTTIAGLFLLLRMYTMLRIIRKIDVTDCLTIVVFVLYLTTVAVARLCIIHGGGIHQWNLTLRELKELLFWMHVNEVIYPVCIVLIKVTILLQYLRILAPNRTVNRTLWYGAWTIIIANVLFYSLNFFVNIFLCSPREKIWDPILKKQPVGHCLDQRAIITSVGIFNIVSDIAILILPTKSVWSLRIPTHKKLKISALFATGVMACGADISMVYFLIRMTSHDADVSYNAIWMGLSALIDICLGVIVSCLLSLPRFLETKGRGILRTFSRPFASLTESWSSRTRTFESKINSSSVATSEGYSKRTKRVTEHQTLSERNLAFDTEVYGQQNDKDITISTVHSQEDVRAENSDGYMV